MRRHAWIATLAIVAAVAIPATVWYGVGIRQMGREERALEEVALREAAEQADDLSNKLSVQLDQIRDHESERQYIDYWPEYLSRGDACTDFLVRKSALASLRRSRDIVAYFQVDENGRLSSPRQGTDLSGIELEDLPEIHAEEPPEYKVAVRMAALPGVNLTLPRSDENAQTGPFRWQTAKWKGQTTLAALRHVNTSAGHYTQGFIIDPGCTTRWLTKGENAHMRPGPAHDRTSSDLPIKPAIWHVTVDPSLRLERARQRAQGRREEFYRTYFAGVLGALLAGACVLVLIRRSDRMAQERSRFAAAAAHELRTPLAGIQLHGEMLALALGNPAKVQQYAQRISAEAERLGRVVTNVLNYARLEEKRLRVELDQGDVGAVVQEVVALVEPVLSRAGATLIVQIAPELPEATFDRDALQQILRNLVENAEKYTRGAADRRIEVTVSPESRDGKRWVTIEVRDHGPGVPQSLRPKLWKSFSRPDNNSQSSGLGLGLSVVKNLAVAQGGDVEHEDAKGGGARFCVRIPVAKAAAG